MARLTDLGRAARVERKASPKPRAAGPQGLVDRVGRDKILRIGTFVGLLLLWEGVSRMLRPIIFTSPGRATEAFLEMLRDGTLVEAWSETLFVLVTALTLSAILGVTLGILLGRFRTASNLVEPQVTALFLTPKVALLPLIALWFGFGDPAKIVVVFLFSFFEIFFTVRNGVRTIDAEYVEVARSYNIPERAMLQKVVVPAAVPYIATGLRLGLLHGMVGVVLVGFFLENNGIGGLLYYHGQDFRVSALFAGLFTVMLLGMAMNQTLRWLEKRVAPWRAGYAS
jgi:sulfonate transport system permease protein